jgi:hypothetical protein
MASEKELRAELHDQAASAHSKNAIFTFFLTGLIILIIMPEKFFQLRTAFFFGSGLFLSSFASVPPYIIKSKLAKKLVKGSMHFMIPIYWIFSSVWNIGFAYLLFLLIYRTF